MDVPSPAAGVVGEIVAKIGDKVSMGTPLLTLEAEGGAPVAAPAPAAKAGGVPRAKSGRAAPAARKCVCCQQLLLAAARGASTSAVDSPACSPALWRAVCANSGST